MSGQLRALKNRIRGVESTQKITRAMEMVAAAKLKRYQKMRVQTAPYAEALEGILDRLLRTDIPLNHPLLEQREEKKSAVLLFTSDTGLCGSYNHNLVEEARKFLKARTEIPLLIGVGKNGMNALARDGYAWHRTFTDIKSAQLETVMTEVCSLIEDLFMEGNVDAVYAIHAGLGEGSARRAAVEQLLPFRVEASSEPFEDTGALYIMEPDRETLFARLVPLVFSVKIRMMFLASLVAEQMARMDAMYQATENAKELIDTLVLLRNKVRQAAITKELIEIVSGSKALKS
ncbi:MAG TPA: ATP synthase F1 subunit gamma [Candidatus Omnitrophota bacterium]|nr:ATP synthase F1 subunit gamma [Candidatus Omnitrophota bacterium]HRY85414.1 ATP synthase F1 subunit gamma [Candidatus Omnitrophota bacterium]